MFGKHNNLITAVLMTMATFAWAFNFFVSLSLRGEAFPTWNLVVFLIFAALSAMYWFMYFRNKSNTSSETE